MEFNEQKAAEVLAAGWVKQPQISHWRRTGRIPDKYQDLSRLVSIAAYLQDNDKVRAYVYRHLTERAKTSPMLVERFEAYAQTNAVDHAEAGQAVKQRVLAWLNYNGKRT